MDGKWILICCTMQFILVCIVLQPSGCSAQINQTVSLRVDAASTGRVIPPKLFGIFFEEINHAGAGGLWAELVNNRGFEAGGPNTPSNIDPWSVIGDETNIWLETDRSSCFERNPIALRVEVICDVCPPGGVGVYNPGFWGMNIVAGEHYKIIFWMRSLNTTNLTVAFLSSNGSVTLAQDSLRLDVSETKSWSKQELLLVANATDHYGRLAFTSTEKGVYWIDQVSAMPVATYKGHGFRKDLALMLEDLKPQFVRFPGGCYVEGGWLRNAFRWRQSIGPWEERPGHFGDVWGYWTDDGIGFYEFFQLAEDLNASPIWVFNNGISHTDEVSSSLIDPFIQDVLDGIEFARGPADSYWGSVRSTMGHPEPFDLQYVAIGNEDCGKQYYQANYMKFFKAIKSAYPDIKMISNCDGSSRPLDHPADFYDFHIYTSASNLFAMTHQFDRTSRVGPKAFVSEYAVTGRDAGKGSLLAALGEGAFLIGLEQNSDVVSMASYAPVFVNTNDRRWNPDAIVFDSWQSYGTPSYWVQQFFRESSGAVLLPTNITSANVSHVLVASTLKTYDSDFLVIKVVNFGTDVVRLLISIDGLATDQIGSSSIMTVLTSRTVMDENSFIEPNMVIPKAMKLANAGTNMDVVIPPISVVALKLQLVTKLHQVM